MRLKGALLRAACTASLSLFLIFACISLAAELEEQTEAVTAVSDAIAPEWEQPEALEAAAYTPPTRTAATTTTATATTAATATAAATTGATATATATATDQTEASVADSAAAAAPLFNPEEPVLLDRREENIPDAVAAAFTATLPHKVKRKQLLAGLALSLIGSLIAGYYVRAYEAFPTSVGESLARRGYVISSRASKEEAKLAGTLDKIAFGLFSSILGAVLSATALL